MDKKRSASILAVVNLTIEEKGPYSFQIESGNCLMITGQSGAGKSLLLRMIADLIPHRGDVFLNSQSCSTFKPSEWRRKITYVAAETGWWGHYVKDHMRDLTLAKNFLERLNLNEALLEVPVTQLSTGEKQRMALLRALSSEVDFLLLDEATSALDPVSVTLVEALIQELKYYGIGIMIVSHNMEQVDRLADQHYQLTSQNLVRIR